MKLISYFKFSNMTSTEINLHCQSIFVPCVTRKLKEAILLLYMDNFGIVPFRNTITILKLMVL